MEKLAGLEIRLQCGGLILEEEEHTDKFVLVSKGLLQSGQTDRRHLAEKCDSEAEYVLSNSIRKNMGEVMSALHTNLLCSGICLFTLHAHA